MLLNINKDEQYYMRLAYEQAQLAEHLGEVPVGCVIVHDGAIIGSGYNRRVTDKNVLSHAELIAIGQACHALDDWRLENCRLFVTVEPCPMCAGAILQARIEKIVFGTENPKAGCAGSILNLLQNPAFNHQVCISAGILREECAALMQAFFRARRGCCSK